MQIAVSQFTNSRGTESLILKIDGTPFFWPNLYTTIHYVQAGKSLNTTRKVLRTLGQCYLWAKSEGLDFDEAIRFGSFLSVENMDSLARFLMLRSFNQHNLSKRSSLRAGNKITTLESVRAISSQYSTNDDFVNTEEAGTRIRIVSDYLTFHLKRRPIPHGQNSSEFQAFVQHSQSSIKYLQQLAPRVRSGSNNEALEGISKNQSALLEEAFTPQNETNPFRSGFNQHRNYLIWRFLYETGIRRHELCGIKVEDVSYSEHRVVIRESKTYARTLPISMSLSEHFHEFVLTYWSRLPIKNTKHGYLFTTRNGARLGLNSINLVFSTLKQKNHHLVFSTNVTPHTLRRTWNDRFSDLLDASPSSEKITSEKESQIRSRLMGWSSNSEQAARYAKRHIRNKADELAEKLANELLSTKAENDD